MKTTYLATIEANVFISDEEFDLIFKAFERHYDRTIKSASEVGGWLFGFKNRRTKFYETEVIEDEQRTVELSSRRIQLIIKSLEMERSDLASKINFEMHKIYSGLVDVHCASNEFIKTIKL